MSPSSICESILSVVQSDPGNRGLARVPDENLFLATRGDFEQACRSIALHPEPRIAIVTGFYIATAEPPAGETDGPLGAVFLARAFELLGISTLLLTDPSSRTALEVGLQAAGVSQTQVLALPVKELPWKQISHLIALERVGPSMADDRCYSMRGRDITEHTAPSHLLFETAAREHSHLVSIGIGDGGNEIGMGKIAHETIVKNIPNGERIHCRVATDFLIVAGVSNWGAYALAAGILLFRGLKPSDSLFDPKREQDILERMVREGPLVDGVTSQQTVSVDGLNWDDYVKPLNKIRDCLEGRV